MVQYQFIEQWFIDIENDEFNSSEFYYYSVTLVGSDEDKASILVFGL